jgi:hypothetical protein
LRHPRLSVGDWIALTIAGLAATAPVHGVDESFQLIGRTAEGTPPFTWSSRPRQRRALASGWDAPVTTDWLGAVLQELDGVVTRLGW